MLGVPVRLRDEATLDDLGLVHAPPPVEPRDLVALEDGPPLRLICLLVTLHRVRVSAAGVGAEFASNSVGLLVERVILRDELPQRVEVAVLRSVDQPPKHVSLLARDTD